MNPMDDVARKEGWMVADVKMRLRAMGAAVFTVAPVPVHGHLVASSAAAERGGSMVIIPANSGWREAKRELL